jgi:hypothetical protein
MNATLCEARQETRTGKRVQTVLRVAEGERYVGDILLDGQGRVWRAASTIPSDVVLKAVIQHGRHEETCGKLVSRLSRRTYLWYVVGGLEGATAGEDC